MSKFENLLAAMPAIADVVNRFTSREMQQRAFEALLAAYEQSAPLPPNPGNGHAVGLPGVAPPTDLWPAPVARPVGAAEPATAPFQLQHAPAHPLRGSAAYSREISRSHKGLFVFLVDLSWSMQEIDNTGQRKMDEVARVVNGWLLNVLMRCTGGAGVRDWIDVAVIGYRTDSQANPIVDSLLDGPAELEHATDHGRLTISSVVSLESSVRRMDHQVQRSVDEETGEWLDLQVQLPVWIDPVAEGGTPTCQAMYDVYELIEAWIERHPASFPPMLIHITDGEAQDGDPVPYAEAIMTLATEDGAALIFNCHIAAEGGEPVAFPHDEGALPPPAQTLFRMSSPLPDLFVERARGSGFDLQPGARGMSYNADLISLIKFLDMGTRVTFALR